MADRSTSVKLATAVAALLAVVGFGIPTATAAPSPTVSSLTLPDASGGWRMTADGGVFTWGRAPFWGSYPGLPAKDRQGHRTFVRLATVGDGKPGYVEVSSAGERYVFRPKSATAKPAIPPTVAPKPVDPPTSVTVTSSANPAAPNDVVTYTITVASTMIPQTTGVLKVTDNGAFLAGCNPIPNPTYEGNGSFVGTCTTTYDLPGTHLVSAVFTGDEVFAQSAGSMVEVVKTAAPGGGGGGGGGAPSPTTIPAPPPAVIGLGITTPTSAQDPVQYLHVNYTSTASTTSNSAPAATAAGTVTFYSDSVPVCTVAVGGSTSSASCPVTYTSFGSHTMTVGYTDNTRTVTTGVQNLTVTPPPLTINNTWGVTAPSNAPTIAAVVNAASATITVTDANWEGATTSGLTSNLGDTCTLTVSGTSGTCTMTVTGVPSSFTIGYAGGTSVGSTQAAAPNGTQQVTTNWPARNVLVSSPSVTVIGATPNWTAATIVAVLNWNPSTGHGTGNAPPLPILTTNGTQLRLSVGTTGNASGHPFPLGSLEFSVSGGTYNAFNFGAFGSGDCAAISNFSGEANGGCAITFTGAGSYTITAWYRSSEPTFYSDVQLSTITVTVS